MWAGELAFTCRFAFARSPIEGHARLDKNFSGKATATLRDCDELTVGAPDQRQQQKLEDGSGRISVNTDLYASRVADQYTDSDVDTLKHNHPAR